MRALTASVLLLMPGRRGHRVGQAVEYGCRLLIADGQRRKEPYDAGVATAELHDEAAVEALPLDGRGEAGVGGAGGADGFRTAHRNAVTTGGGVGVRSGLLALGVHQLDPDHQATPTDIPHARELCLKCAQLGHHPGAEGGGSFGQAVLADVGQGGGARGHGELVAAEGAGVGAGLPDVEVVAVDENGQGEAAADGLGQDHDVGGDTAVLDGPEGARAADARLDLVGDQRDGPVCRDLPHAAQPVVRRRDHSALALDGFEDHPGGQRYARLGVVEEGLAPAGGEFGATRAADAEGAAVVLRVRQAGDPYVAGAAGGGQGSGGHAVVGTGEGEDAGAPGRRPDEFEGGLDRVGAGRPAELDAGAVGEPGRQGAEQLRDEGVLDRGRQVENGEWGAGVEDPADGLQHDRMVVAEGEGSGTGETVQIAAAVGALDGHSPCPDRHDGQGPGIGARSGLTRRLAPQDPVVRCTRSPVCAISHRFGHGHGSLSSPLSRGKLIRGAGHRQQAPHRYQPRTDRGVTG